MSSNQVGGDYQFDHKLPRFNKQRGSYVSVRSKRNSDGATKKSSLSPFASRPMIDKFD